MARSSRDDIDHFHNYGLHIPTRTIDMSSEDTSEDGESGVDFQMAKRTIKNLHILDQTPDKPITIIMNNIGGDEYHGMAIYDAIKECKNHVTIKVYGHAMSMGSLILQAADERLMMPNSRIMIHYGTWGTHDHPKITYNLADEGKKWDRTFENIYLDRIHAKHPQFKLKQLTKMLDFDTFLNAEESLNLGLIDGIVKE